MIAFLIEHADTSAYLAGTAWILGFIALFVFFAIGGIFGPINDAFSVFQFLFMIPLALALHRLLARHIFPLSLGATIVGIAVMLVMAVLQALLVLGVVRFEQSLKPILALGAVLGLWWLATSIPSLAYGALLAGLAWAGIVAGASDIIGAVGFWIGGQEHPLAAISFVALALSAPTWTIWLGRVLAASAVP
ncbi:MAG: hypothetical protein JXA89_09040 [Anaerolineae bacterium]|nr:hypothetical protein [Anaerolineae bacterium]